MSEYRDYENGIADVLEFLSPEGSIVERNVTMDGRLSKVKRQVDVVVRGRIFGMSEGFMAVDCKCWSKQVDVKAVESFISNLGDIGADFGLLMTTKGSSDAARERAKAERGVDLAVMSLQELRAWSPKGTVTVTYRLPAGRRSDAEKALRNAGYRVAGNLGYDAAPGVIVLDVFRFYGTPSPSSEIQSEQMRVSLAALTKLGVDPEHVANGVTMGGGTPAHRWVEIAIDGEPTGLKVLAGSRGEADRQIDSIYESTLSGRIDRRAITVIAPDGWPFSGFFGARTTS